MKISEAQPTYYANRRELVDQIRTLADRKEKAEQRFRITGDSTFSDEAATLPCLLKQRKKPLKTTRRFWIP